ncbi:MAG: DUF2256 domain-containing protein [Thermoleophilia bacterium]|nr:DUF2256 domain-containing protein [Thermoleophilia bacterium]
MPHRGRSGRTEQSDQSQAKVCASCHRPFENRRTWSSRGVWEQVLFCSKACKARGRRPAPDAA